MKHRYLIKTISFLLFLTGQIHAQFSTSGTNTTTTNNVGIGTSSPNAKLNIINTQTIGWSDISRGGLLLGSSSLGIGLDNNEIAAKGTNLYFGTITNHDIYFRTGGANNRMLIDGSTGNVGFGTTNPQQKLDVRGNALIGGGDLILGKYDGREQGDNTQNRAMVHGFSDDLIINYDADFEGGVKINGDLTTSANVATGGNITVGGADLILGTNDAREQGNNTQNRALVHGFNDDLIINYDGDFEGGTIIKGNVGIGITDPKEKLHINGSVRGNQSAGTLRVQTDHGSLDLGARNSSWAHIYTDMPKIIFNKDVYTTSNAFSSYNNDLILKTEGKERLRINDDTGNVGIGTTNPQNELSVNGTIWAKVMKVRLTDAADWVFDEKYKLRPLAEVKSFISKNKHLPEIPSAAEFKANDMDVSEMTNKLLQKIEELTLYTIQQEEKLKEMDQLKARLSKLEALLQ